VLTCWMVTETAAGGSRLYYMKHQGMLNCLSRPWFDLQAITVSEAAYWWCNYQQQFELADLRVISCDFLLFSTCKQGRFLGMLAFLAAKPIRNSRRFVLVISCLLNPILGSWTTTMGQSQHCCTGQAQLGAAHWWWFSAAM